MTKKFNIKKGDTVIVIAGDSKGQQGRVFSVNREKDTAIVEGVHLISIHTKLNAPSPHGVILKKEASIHVSTLMLIDASTGKPTRIGRKLNEANKIVRYSKKSGEEIK